MLLSSSKNYYVNVQFWNYFAVIGMIGTNVKSSSFIFHIQMLFLTDGDGSPYAMLL